MPDIREEFEAWVSGRKVCTRYGAKLTTNPDGMYSDYRINDRWLAWQASRAALKVELPPTITEAAEAGDERVLLVALRKKLAQTIQDSSTPARDQASLSIRLLQINRDIQAIDARAKEEGQDAAEVEDEAFDPEAL